MTGTAMTSISVLPNMLDRFSVAELAALPVLQKLEIQRDLDAAAQWLKRAQEKFADALLQAYGAQCRQALKESGRDFGAVQGRDGVVEIVFEQPKRVKWDQAKLSELAERIVAGGEKAGHYIEAKLSVSENKWKAWPPVLQQQFAPARSVESGKASITLRVIEEGAA